MNQTKRIILLSVTTTLIALFSGAAFGFELMSTEEALKQIFGTKPTIVEEEKELEGDVLDAVKERLGGSLVDSQEGSESAQVEKQDEVTFYFAEGDGKRYGVAVVDTQPGKWGPVKYIIAMDMEGIVRTVKVLSYEEKRGRPIARSSFLNQFKGKSSDDPIEVGKDISGISGATISSRSSAFAVRKAIVLYEELYQKNNG
jgi:electron transport complex protein RnfG